MIRIIPGREWSKGRSTRPEPLGEQKNGESKNDRIIPGKEQGKQRRTRPEPLGEHDNGKSENDKNYTRKGAK
jgi:hypothetical protein